MKWSFSKISGNGNDFIIFDDANGMILPKETIERLCHRHFGIGADGLLLVGTAPEVNAVMRIFNADGGEAEMCGNGLRCLAAWLDRKSNPKKDSYRIKTMNNTYEVLKKNGNFIIEMTGIKDQNAFDLSEFHDFEKNFFINTGVPHLVFLGTDVRKIEIKKIAPFYRFHEKFPKGTNVSFVELLPEAQSAYVRTYERGVEDETYSCGTGLTATGLALSHWFGWKGDIHLSTLGGKQTVTVDGRIYYSGEITFCFDGEITL